MGQFKSFREYEELLKVSEQGSDKGEVNEVFPEDSPDISVNDKLEEEQLIS